MAGQYCTFLLDGHLFGVPVESIQEVLGPRDATDVPLAPAAVRGLLNLRGQIVTMLDMRTRLGLRPRDDASASTNVVVRTPDGPVSLLVDRIGEVIAPPESAFECVPEMVPAAVRSVATSVCKLERELMLVLD
ncbi:MAG: chemotaxis protein CheW, partial [Nocardioidaceae bacterium]